MRLTRLKEVLPWAQPMPDIRLCGHGFRELEEHVDHVACLFERARLQTADESDILYVDDVGPRHHSLSVAANRTAGISRKSLGPRSKFAVTPPEAESV